MPERGDWIKFCPIMEYKPTLQSFEKREPFSVKWLNGVLLRSTNWLGDALMTLPAAWQLSRLKPSACGFFVLSPRGLAPLWRACPWVDAVIEMEGKRISRQEARDAHRLHPGVGVVFPNSFGAALDMWRCGVPMRIGRTGRLRGLLLNGRLPEWKRTKWGEASFHQLSWYLDLVSSLGEVELSPVYPSLKVDTGLAAEAGMNGDGWLAIAPGAAYGPAKQWPAEHFLEVARWHAERGGRIVLVGTGREAAVTSWLSERLPGSLDLAGKTGLPALMSVLAACRAVVANDSGAMHLAAAVGTSGVAVFGSTDPVATGPVGAPWRYLASDEPCRPCFRRECPRGDYRCLKGILPEKVIAELREILE